MAKKMSQEMEKLLTNLQDILWMARRLANQTNLGKEFNSAYKVLLEKFFPNVKDNTLLLERKSNDPISEITNYPFANNEKGQVDFSPKTYSFDDSVLLVISFARRYSHMRRTYAPSMFNDAYDNIREIIGEEAFKKEKEEKDFDFFPYAKDGDFDKSFPKDFYGKPRKYSKLGKVFDKIETFVKKKMKEMGLKKENAFFEFLNDKEVVIKERPVNTLLKEDYDNAKVLYKFFVKDI